MPAQPVRLGGQNLVAEQGAHATLEHVAVLVLVEVAVQRCGERAGGHRVLDEREALPGLRAIDHEADPDAAEESRRAVLRADDLGGGLHGTFLSSNSSVA